MSGWVLDDNCVAVKKLEPNCPGCEDGRTTHYVEIDLGSITLELFRGCESCTSGVSAEFCAALPSAERAL